MGWDVTVVTGLLDEDSPGMLSVSAVRHHQG